MGCEEGPALGPALGRLTVKRIERCRAKIYQGLAPHGSRRPLYSHTEYNYAAIINLNMFRCLGSPTGKPLEAEPFGTIADPCWRLGRLARTGLSLINAEIHQDNINLSMDC